MAYLFQLVAFSLSLFTDLLSATESNMAKVSLENVCHQVEHVRAHRSPAAVIIRLEDPAQSDVVELLRHGEAFSASVYPPESNHHLPLHALRRPAVRFLVARDADRKALATGALVLHGDWAEINVG
jgi:hypothetical protein